MKSHEVLSVAVDKVGVKALAAKLKLSTALVYKWCQESPGGDPGASGARNPLDRIREVYESTRDHGMINWICNIADGFFVPNPAFKPPEREEQLLDATQRMVREFGDLLQVVSRSFENDGQISREEAAGIRQTWETLKSQAEGFVVSCERGLFGRK